jgi:hypothetical protein
MQNLTVSGRSRHLTPRYFTDRTVNIEISSARPGLSTVEGDFARSLGTPLFRQHFGVFAGRRKTRGEHFGGPYIALLNHPELARRVEELGFFLKFEGVLPRPVYQGVEVVAEVADAE